MMFYSGSLWFSGSVCGRNRVEIEIYPDDKNRYQSCDSWVLSAVPTIYITSNTA